MKKWLEKTKLKGHLVTLVPLGLEHKKALLDAASDGRLWDLWYTGVPSNESIDGYINTALDDFNRGTSLAFVVEENKTGKIVGSTRFCRAEIENKRVEIGHTWYAKSYQRTGINSECKLLMLTHAFEVLSAIAVEFRTHWHNQPSRKAIARLGAKQDGVLRNHKKDPDGAYRDTVVFSIIDQEWKAVKKSLSHSLNAKT